MQPFGVVLKDSVRISRPNPFYSRESSSAGKDLPVTKVVVTQQVADSVLTYSRSAYPREGILLLRGSSKKGVVTVDSVAIPPMATHGEGFSGFNWWNLPIDLSFIGV